MTEKNIVTCPRCRCHLVLDLALTVQGGIAFPHDDPDQRSVVRPFITWGSVPPVPSTLEAAAAERSANDEPMGSASHAPPAVAPPAVGTASVELSLGMTAPEDAPEIQPGSDFNDLDGTQLDSPEGGDCSAPALKRQRTS